MSVETVVESQVRGELLRSPRTEAECREYRKETSEQTFLGPLVAAVLVVRIRVEGVGLPLAPGVWEYLVRVAPMAQAVLEEHLQVIRRTITPSDRSWRRVEEDVPWKWPGRPSGFNPDYEGYVLAASYRVMVRWPRILQRATSSPDR